MAQPMNASAFKVGMLSLMVIWAMSHVAEAKTCAELSLDLRAMQKAQSSLLQTMVRNNGSMAETLDQLGSSYSTKSQVKRNDVMSIKKSAQAFRNHEQREGKLVERFEAKTAELLTLVEGCLRSKTIASE